MIVSAEVGMDRNATPRLCEPVAVVLEIVGPRKPCPSRASLAVSLQETRPKPTRTSHWKGDQFSSTGPPADR